MKDDPSDFPAPPAPEPIRGAIKLGMEELEAAQNAPANLENIALVHASLAIGYLLVALCERIDRVSEPIYTHPSGTVQYQIKTGG